MFRKFIIVFITIISSNFYLLCSPYEVSNATETAITTAVTTFGLVYNLTNVNFEPLSESQIDKLMEKELLSINRISVDNYNNDLATLSDILLGLSLTTSALQVFDGRISQDWTIYGLMYLESAALTIGTATVTKNIIRDPRPYVYSKNAPLDIKLEKDARQSFFSGHAGLSFFAMTFFAETYCKYYPENSNHRLIWLGSMSLASATAILRVFSGRHFPIDIIVGAAVGFAVGKLIPYLHESSNNDNFIINNQTNKILSFRLNI